MYVHVMGAQVYSGTHTCVCMRRGQRSMLTSFLVALHLGSGLTDLAMLAGQQASLGLADVAKWHIHLDGKMGLYLPPDYHARVLHKW